MSDLLVSIIIPAYNVAPWLGAALESILAQSVTDWECLVVDDGSSDSTAAVAASFKDSRIRVLSQANKGVSAARNRGLCEASGRFVAFLDGDDLWRPDALKHMLAPMLADIHCDFVYADHLRFEDGTGRIMPRPDSGPHSSGDLWLDMLVDNCLQFGAICLRAALAKRELFDETLVICEDRDWLLRVLKGVKHAYAPGVIHFYRQRQGSAVRDAARFIADETRLMAEHLADPDVPACVRRRSQSALDFHAAVLLAKIPGKRGAALGRYCLAVFRDPLYLENYLRPLRKLWFNIIPAQYIETFVLMPRK